MFLLSCLNRNEVVTAQAFNYQLRAATGTGAIYLNTIFK